MSADTSNNEDKSSTSMCGTSLGRPPTTSNLIDNPLPRTPFGQMILGASEVKLTLCGRVRRGQVVNNPRWVVRFAN